MSNANNDIIKEEQRRYKKEWRDKNREHLREYHKKWRQKNKDKLADYNKNYWLKKAQERKERENIETTTD